MIDEGVPEGIPANNGAPDLPIGAATTADVDADQVLPGVSVDNSTSDHIIPTNTLVNSPIDSSAKAAGVSDSGPHVDPMTITGENVDLTEAEKNWPIPIDRAKKAERRGWRQAIAWLGFKEEFQDKRLKTPQIYDIDKNLDRRVEDIEEKAKERAKKVIPKVLQNKEDRLEDAA